MATLIGRSNHLTQLLSSWGSSRRLPGKQEKERILHHFETLDRLEEVCLLGEVDRLRRVFIRAQYDEFLLRDEIYWKYRSREK